MGRGICRSTRAAALLLIPAIAFTMPATAGAKSEQKSSKPKVVGAFYTETNGNPNKLLVFDRYSDGTLKQTNTVATGGQGGHQGQPINVMAPPPVCTGNGAGCPALDSQDAIALTPNGKFLFAVNAGSSTVSSFKVTNHKPVLVNEISSGGTFPDSLSVHGNVLYVLNSNSLNIQGMTFNSGGVLHAISGGSQPLSPGGTIPGAPRDIHFDNTGKWLVVTKLANPMTLSPVGTIDTFPVNSSGVAGAAVPSDSFTPVPFSVGFDSSDHPIITTLGNPFAFKAGALESYSIGANGSLTHIASGSTVGYAPCWDVESSNRKYGYIVNADILGPAAPSVSTFKLAGNGHFTFLGHTARSGDEPLQTDIALSSDGKYMYVVAPIDDRAFAGVNISHIDVYKIGSNHQPTLIQQTPFKLAQGLTGAAAS
jgi:6-phosphogluconolactonase